MKKRIISSLLLMMALFASLTGQAQTPPQQQRQRDAQDDDVVRITTNLVQIDAVVLDKDGRQVTDLGPQDFEILEDARPQKVTNFSYISTDGAGGATVVKSAPASAAPVPPARIRPGQARRTLALVVDDLGLSFETAAYVRQYLKDFVEKQMQPGDLVAVVRTSAGVGAFQQLRVAVRDASTQRTGSANEFIEVPDMNRGYLALSGIALSGRNPSQVRKEAVSTATTPSAHSSAGSEAAAEDVDPQANPAIRRLRPGMELRYDYLIYNAQLDPATNRPQLMVQTRLFREGRMLYEGKPAPFETSQQADLKRLLAGGSIKLSRAAPPGDYVLQLIVTDALAKDKYRTATQWIDFELAGN